ncbi:MAG: type IV-A pilus assembly ATPase PilB [Candidatus Schekmanbacteria bacterium GWA2_38_9]|uniref:Type IV-A pilus assembly ATPase PilB n=1 Tax=Candidatus Schekmanbacteria bacterium RIFCSPLOWO2_12_FULL_38_15 TaxID=1817883 RepID=A0A1F7SG76_9BACT|nr:MAG: type IV-A pilus assembly ATPase PilB [Candidatus Schekmanbacteria bacterium GWA2_38_9]OGL49870.1 MAG: type IV-A pilus assembly ATPase PilB [Candidatus Schekmanbacteria bacterium RIFCSPLOWO2_02_FULL_38_14]OGL52790.1 MAG: type IV-A pilus assembly ATPase PilB [Candidatus Schekmanbacteria bacterium RIFCSPLOWO2_12_FULL_38_15]
MARFGELLIEAGLINNEQLEEALKSQKELGGRLGSILVKRGLISEDTVTSFLSQQYGVPSINLDDFEIDPAICKLIPVKTALKYEVIPISRVGSTLTVAMVDPSNVFAIDDIKFMTGYNVEPVVAPETAIKEAIKRYYHVGVGVDKGKDEPESAQLDAKDYEIEDSDAMDGLEGIDEGPVVDVDDFDQLVSGAVDTVEVVQEQEDENALKDVDAPVVKLVNGILIKAIKMKVSDVHIEPYEKVFRVRYRMDGVLHKAMGLPLRIKNAITSRIKIMARLDISERRLPQDGRIKLKLGKNKEMDFRVSVLPTLFGEKVVLRLLDQSNLQLDMTKLGFDKEPLSEFQEAIHLPYGMVLVTGPTGSGKTTTLYSAISELNKVSENIMTAEDPVEFNLPGVNQVQMHEDIGLNFAAALRSFLRQDPDIILVGEIRDYETAEIGIKASLTGHLVLSTLHTNSAPETINRLLNMGVEPFLVASSVNMIIAQRLARKVCAGCKEPVDIKKEALVGLQFKEEDWEKGFTVYKGKGCSICGGTGYKGRVALYEVMSLKREIRELILQGSQTPEIKAQAIKLGMQSLRRSGLKKIMEGTTTPEEIVRVTMPD